MITHKHLLAAMLGWGIMGTPTLFGQTANSAAPTNTQARAHAWWHDAAPGERPYRLDNKKLPLICVKGNKFVGPGGDSVVFRGVSISDPDKFEMQGHWNKAHFEKVKELGA